MGRGTPRTLATLCALGVLMAIALAQASAQERDSESKTTVRVALSGFENNITPLTLTFGALPNTHDLMNLVYDTLFWSQVKEEPEPWLAEKAEPSDDFRTWTITLRPGVRWHDGEPLTAEDVKFSFDYYVKTVVSGRYAHHAGDQPPYVGGEVLDERTVELRFAQPTQTFKIMPGADLPILPKHIWEDVEQPAKATSMEFSVGSGPFEVVDIESDQLYRLRANDDYFKGKPLVDELVMPIVQDPTAAFQALRAGQVDLVTQNVPPELVDRFSSSGEIEVEEGTRFESSQLYFNAQKPPLDDPRLRKAISLAIDNEALVDRVLQGDGEPGDDSFIHPDSPWALPDAGHEHDPARARRLLDEAGYREGDGGVRVSPDGEPLRFSILVSSFEPEFLRAAQLIARQTRDIGVSFEPESLDPAALRQRREPGRNGEAPYDTYMSGLETHAHVDPDALYYFFHSPGSKGFGGVITGYSNREFDRLVERATTMGLDERKPVLHEAERILAEEVPVATLWYRDGVYAHRPAAYDRWLSDPGHGLFTKRSFLPAYAPQGGGGGSDDGGAALPIGLSVFAGLALIGGIAVARRRRSAAAGEDEADF